MSASREASRRSLLFVQQAGAGSKESAAAQAWLRGQRDIDAQPVSAEALAEALPGHGTTIWCHWTEPPLLSDAARLALDAHVRAGGGLLATLAAATLPVELGWEEVPPDEATDARWCEEPEDEPAKSFSVPPIIRGLQSFRGHPLFDGLGSGAYTWAPRESERLVRYAYTGENWPQAGRVIAVQRSFIAMNPERRLAWEYIIGDGWAVCIGGYLYFAAQDSRYRRHLERLVRNALERVSANGTRVHLLGGAWKLAKSGARLDAKVPLQAALVAAYELEVGGGLHLEREATDAPFTLAGSRAAVMGQERTGIEEVWFHPFRAVSRWALRSAGDDRQREAAGGAMASRIRVGPGIVARRLQFAAGSVDERTAVARDEPAVVVDLVPSGLATTLAWTLETDLRLMWPYPPDAVGELAYAVQGGAFGVQSETGEWLGVRVEPAPVVMAVANASAAGRSRLRIEAKLEPDSPTRILLTGATRDERPLVRLEPFGRRPRIGAGAEDDVDGLSLHCGDAELEAAIRWACWRLASCRARVPGLGTSLVAGYARSTATSFGDGRPGYAWCFGRDACWTAMGCLAAGQSELARETLEFLGRHQDITGKILHECTTSGVVHYDAADSTPLYLLLAARYHAWTGDAETLEREWSSIMRAYRYCLSTDTDGDALIENTGVGHGWVEFGSLGGHHVSLYLAGIWAAALGELEVVARALEDDAFASELAYRAAAVRSSLELSFYDPLQARYADGLRRDGSPDWAETIMTAVPLALGAIRAERCEAWLDRVAGEDFSTPWGVRFVPRSDPGYKPDGYHAGSVWPLHSGWVSLAEYRAGRAESAFRHWRQTARLFRQHALGAWPEVLHGDESRAIGVTSDQAWSTAMAVLPLVEGLFGIRPVAHEGRLDVAPQLPAQWSEGSLRRLRVGGRRVTLSWPGGDGEIGLDVRVEGAPLDVRRFGL